MLKLQIPTFPQVFPNYLNYFVHKSAQNKETRVWDCWKCSSNCRNNLSSSRQHFNPTCVQNLLYICKKVGMFFVEIQSWDFLVPLPTAISCWIHQFSSDHWSQATLSLVSTWMGDRLGTLGAVGIRNFLQSFPLLFLCSTHFTLMYHCVKKGCNGLLRIRITILAMFFVVFLRIRITCNFKMNRINNFAVQESTCKTFVVVVPAYPSDITDFLVECVPDM